MGRAFSICHNPRYLAQGSKGPGKSIHLPHPTLPSTKAGPRLLCSGAHGWNFPDALLGSSPGARAQPRCTRQQPRPSETPLGGREDTEGWRHPLPTASACLPKGLGSVLELRRAQPRGLRGLAAL